MDQRHKNEIMTKLLTIKEKTTDEVWKAWLGQAIDYIKEAK